jgi:hypothetical protein
MNIRGRARASVAVLVVGFVLVVGAMSLLAQAQQQNTKKPDKAQQQEADALSQVLASVQSGQPAPSDMAVGIESYHSFRSANGQTYIAFTVTVDGKGLASPAVALMLRVVNRNGTTVASGADKKPGVATASNAGEPGDDTRARMGGERSGKAAVAPAAYEDLDFTSLKPAEPGQPSRLSRAFQVPAGEYDIYFGLKERNTGDKKQKPKFAVCKQPLTVPDYGGSDLITSSVILAAKMDVLPKALAPDEQRSNPYTIGLLEIVPKVGTEFARGAELGIYFQIYNEALDATSKPNVQVDFLFYRKQADGEKKIANSEPQILNGTTLPPQFDVTKHQLAGSSAWPLTSFQPGSFRLEIKITDKISGKSLTKDVTFSVS